MNQKHHNRSSSHGLGRATQGQPRPSKHKPPPPPRKGQSYEHAPSTPSSRSGLGGGKKVLTEVVSTDDEEETGMASFLQFCTTCEKQIVTPGSTILYCSEACRKKDILTQTPIENVQSPSLVSSSTSYFDIPQADILPKRSPTVLRPLSLTFYDLTVSDNEPSTEDFQKRFDPYESEARKYLAQFHSQSEILDTRSTTRRRVKRASTATESGIPSLVNTPSSSVGTAGSMASYQPLPPRADPATGHVHTKSADLVIPVHPTMEPSSPTQLMKDLSMKSSASTITSLRTAQPAEVSFSRVTPRSRDSTHSGRSLKHLFGQEAMKADSSDV